MADLNHLKSVRKANRGVITKLFTKIEESRDAQLTEEEKSSVITNFEKLLNKQTFIEELSEQILGLTATEDVENEVMDTEDYSVNIETRIKNIRKFVKDLYPSDKPSRTQEPTKSQSLNTDAPSFIPVPTNTQSAHSSQAYFVHPSHIQSASPSYAQPQPASTLHAQHYDSHPMQFTSQLHGTQQSMSNFSRASNDSHRLPKLTLPKFSGNILEWQTFWDSFESAVHLNTSLTNVQKFNYLKAQLEREALQSIAGFALTNLNYDEAINVLKDRFGNGDNIISTYLEALIEIPQPKNEISSLKTFYDQIESYVRGLDALGESQETYGKLLIPIIMKKLPAEMRRNLRRVHGASSWILQDLRKDILEEINIMEEGHDADIYGAIPTTASFVTGTRPKPRQNQNRYVPQSTEKRCVFCNDIHSAINCTKFKEVSDRVAIVKREQLCFNCLGKHRLSECKSNRTCKNCKKRHHTSICTQANKPVTTIDNEQKQKSTGNRNTRQQGNPTDQPQQNSTSINLINNADTSILYSTDSRCSILLKTAVAPVGYNHTFVDSNILFDEGAQRSFVTEELAQKIKLKRTGSEELNLST